MSTEARIAADLLSLASLALGFVLFIGSGLCLCISRRILPAQLNPAKPLWGVANPFGVTHLAFGDDEGPRRQPDDPGPRRFQSSLADNAPRERRRDGLLAQACIACAAIAMIVAVIYLTTGAGLMIARSIP